MSSMTPFDFIIKAFSFKICIAYSLHILYSMELLPMYSASSHVHFEPPVERRAQTAPDPTTESK